GLRRNHVLVEILTTVPDGLDEAAEARHRQWARATLHALDRIALPGGYPNLLGPEELDRAVMSYGPNGERFARAKSRYDPDGVFSSVIPLPLSMKERLPFG